MRLRRWLLTLTAAGLLSTASCSFAGGGLQPSDQPTAGPTAGASSGPSTGPTAEPTASEGPVSTAEPRRACRSRPSEGLIIVRLVSPGREPTARLLGGGWIWDDSAAECVTMTEAALRANPKGSCTQIGRVSKNPGYDADRRPAPPLKAMDEERGAC